LNYRTIYRW